MSTVPSGFQLKREDFPDGLSSKEDFERFANQFNTFIRQVVALGQAVNVSQNLDGLLSSFPLTSTSFPQSMTIAAGRQPSLVLLAGCVDNSQTGTTPTVYPVLTWKYQNPAPGALNLLQFSLSGLTVGRNYTATVLVLYAPAVN